MTKKIFFFNLIEFVKQSLHLKTILTALFLVEQQRAQGKKRKFLRINLQVEIFLFACVFLKRKIYIPTHIRLMRVSRWQNMFHPGDFRKQDYFFWPRRPIFLRFLRI